MKMTGENDHPAIILGLNNTGLATARCLAARGVAVYGVSLDEGDVGRWSRCCEVVKPEQGIDLLEWLRGFSLSLLSKPVVIPSGDALALLLAENHGEVARYAFISDCSYAKLRAIVHKDGLSELGRAAGVPVPPLIRPDNHEQLLSWCESHKPPYLAKPFFLNIDGCALKSKNERFDSVSELSAFVLKKGCDKLVIQQLLAGGDGNIYDCYGLCDRQGSPVKLASHKRIRQWKTDFGATCYGEIPGFKDKAVENRIFSQTRKLLESCDYHGIFGIEWLHDVESDQYLLIDFNARPFSSIGHLADCGLNLPLANYLELTGQPQEEPEEAPDLEHKYWLHFVADLRSLPGRLRAGRTTLLEWLTTVIRARSYALWSLGDPLPGLVEFVKLPLAIGSRLTRKTRGLFFGSHEERHPAGNTQRDRCRQARVFMPW